MSKMTNKEALIHVRNLLCGNDVDVDVTEVIHKLDSMVIALEKKTANKKPTAKQQENECHKQQILDTLAGSENPQKCGEIAKALDISGQKCSALLTQLVDAGAVDRVEGEKKQTLFRLHVAA